jgi:hypothetical protein
VLFSRLVERFFGQWNFLIDYYALCLRENRADALLNPFCGVRINLADAQDSDLHLSCSL